MEFEKTETPDPQYKRVKLLVTIVDRGKGKKIVELCKREFTTFHLALMGRGTAKSDILDYLGIGETEKDIVLSVVLEERLPRVLKLLEEEMDFDQPGHGIAFTIPISSVGGPITLQYISGLFSVIAEFAGKRSEHIERI